MPLTYIEGYEVNDLLPLNRTFGGGLLFVQDFFAPATFFLNATFKGKLEYKGSQIDPEEAVLSTTITRTAFNKHLNSCNLTLRVSSNLKIELIDNDSNISTVCELL